MEHCISVADLSSKLCRRFGLDSKKGSICGLAHDMLKDRPVQDQWTVAQRASSIPCLDFVATIVERIEGEKAFADKIIHGPAAAVYINEEFRLEDREMLEAIALHSSAAITMSPLAKVLFVADKLEPKRAYVTSDELEMADTLDLDTLLAETLGMSIGWLRRKNSAIAQSTIDLYNALTMRESAS
ncbi:MAG: bis(5'-nucleosyl)-tetraphosphatase (symmetrical) YqeK [Rectinemataceae bacterium]|nr:bis(5'-nucleosyl)-tetraphosphatase (symmetrical) YqeK [Rectinemataceae bacterium]